MLKTVIFVASTMILVACSSYYSSNGEEKYLRSTNGPHLLVPAPLTRVNLSDFYNLPNQDQNPKISIAPPTH